MSVIVKNSGFYSAIQDRGRRGLRHLGVPWSGIGCEPWMRFANALLNQHLHTPVIETIEGGLSLLANHHPIRVAMVGDVSASILAANGTLRSAQGWRSFTLNIGDTLTIKSTGRFKCAVVAIDGLKIPSHYGSASTYPNAHLGGLNGSILAMNDALPVAAQSLASSDLSLPPFHFPGEATEDKPFSVCAVAGPQDDYFSADTLKVFFNTTYQLSQNIDRMGARLIGATLPHKSAELRDLVSDAIVPGSVQVPGSGLPIVMLADAHTIGGYPKIATVLSSDLSLFSLYRPEQSLVFKQMDNESALAHTRRIESLVQAHLEKLSPVIAQDLSSERLLGLNLVSGVSDALQ